MLLFHGKINSASYMLFQFAQSTIFHFWTPDSLRGYVIGIPNSALWSVGVMVQCYIALWFSMPYLLLGGIWVRIS